MSRPGPVIAADGRADPTAGSPSLRRGRPPGAQARIEARPLGNGWGPHPDARTHRGPVGPVAPPPFAAPRPPAPAVPRADPALLPVLAPRPHRPLTFVQRVTLMLRQLGGRQGRHRSGRSRHGWSMFAPHPGARRRSGSRPRR